MMKMIKYTASQFYGPDTTDDEVTGFMVELWNDYGNISCRTILNLPDGEKDLRLWFYDSVVAIPDMRICFRTPRKLTYTGVFNIVREELSFEIPMSVALAATIMVMKTVIDCECGHFDINTNLAECTKEVMDYDYYMEDEAPLPF